MATLRRRLRRLVHWSYLGLWLGTFLLVYTYQNYKKNDAKNPEDVQDISNAIAISDLYESMTTLDELSSNYKINEPINFDFNASKKILFYTSFYEWNDYEFGVGNLPFVEHGCPVSNCYATSNKTLLSK